MNKTNSCPVCEQNGVGVINLSTEETVPGLARWRTPSPIPSRPSYADFVRESMRVSVEAEPRYPSRCGGALYMLRHPHHRPPSLSRSVVHNTITSGYRGETGKGCNICQDETTVASEVSLHRLISYIVMSKVLPLFPLLRALTTPVVGALCFLHGASITGSTSHKGHWPEVLVYHRACLIDYNFSGAPASTCQMRFHDMPQKNTCDEAKDNTAEHQAYESRHGTFDY